MAEVYEHLLSINKFNRPIDLTDEYAIHTILVRLILLEPGTFETHPDMGVGIVSKYRFADSDIAVSELRTDVQRQIATYLPEFNNVEVQIAKEKEVIGFRIRVSDFWYNLNFNTETQTISDVNL